MKHQREQEQEHFQQQQEEPHPSRPGEGNNDCCNYDRSMIINKGTSVQDNSIGRPIASAGSMAPARTLRRRNFGHGGFARWSLAVVVAFVLAASAPPVAEARPTPLFHGSPVHRIAPAQRRVSLWFPHPTEHHRQPPPPSLWSPDRLVAPARAFAERVRSRVSDLGPRDVFRGLVRMARAWVFWYFSKDCMDSIYEDRWHAERDPEDFFGSGGMWISRGAHKNVVKRRIQRSKRNRQWVGLGYTPRLVWLVGVLLRGTFQCTSIPKVFNPRLTGWGAGTVLGAKCTHQEWIAAFMLGWFGTEHYWKFLFGCDGPPHPGRDGFDGVPITINKVRLF